MIKKLLMLTPFVGLGALAQTPSALPDYARIVQAYADARGFMGTVILEQDGRLIFRKSVGKASLEFPASFTNRTVFAVGSLTKSFTAAAVLRLQEQGKLKVSDPLSKHLPDFPGAENITLHQLLTHTSGIGGLQDVPDFINVQRHALNLDQTLALFRDKPAHFAPGTRFEYSNAGYLVLSKVIEVAAGVPFATYLNDQILVPSGFKNTRFHTRDDIIPRLAYGHLFDGIHHKKAGYFDPELPAGGGALYSTARELVGWIPSLLAGRVLKPESAEQMVAPWVPVADGIHYAYGLQVGVQDGRKVILHGGLISGYHALALYFPDTRLSLVVLSNVENAPVEELGKSLERAHFGEPDVLPEKKTFVELEPEVLQKYVGTYTLVDLGLTVKMVIKDGALQMQDPRGDFYPLLAENPTTFHQAQTGTQVRFSDDASSLTLIQGGQRFEGRKVIP